MGEIYYIDLDKYGGELQIKGRMWWEKTKGQRPFVEALTLVTESKIVKKGKEEKREKWEQLIYESNGKPMFKRVVKTFVTTKRYIIFRNFDDAVNLRIENAEFADELPSDTNAIEIPLTVDSFGFHHVIDAIDFTWNLNRR